MTWLQIIWFFFPLPIICLVLLAVPLPPRMEKMATNLVGGIFFAKLSLGVFNIRVLWIFFFLSVILFANTVNGLRPKTQPLLYDGLTMWHSKALRYRSERNFWVALFNMCLWLLVWELYRLKKAIVTLKDELRDYKAIAKVQQQKPEEKED